MVHTKFQSHRSVSYGEEDFEGFLPYVVTILVM